MKEMRKGLLVASVDLVKRIQGASETCLKGALGFSEPIVFVR